MRKLIYLIVIVAIIIAAAPFIDGYLFKNSFYQQVGLLQNELAKENNTADKTEIKIDNYQMGWLQSTADLSITTIKQRPNRPTVPITFHVKSIIHHGPLVWFDSSPRLAAASIDTSVFLPEFLSMIIKTDESGFLQIHTLASLSGNKWTYIYTVAPKSLEGLVTWGGLKGDSKIVIANSLIEKLNNTLTFGKLNANFVMYNLPNVSVDAMQFSNSAERQSPNAMTGVGTASIPKITAKWQDGRTFDLTDLTVKADYSMKDKIYQYHSETFIQTINFPATFPVQYISLAKHVFSLNDINLGYIFDNYKNWNNQEPNPDEVIVKLFTPNSKISSNLSLTTELGAVLANIQISLMSVPANLQALMNVLNIDANVQIPQALAQKLMAMSITQTLNQQPQTVTMPQDPLKQAEFVLAAMVQRGYLQTNNQNYTFVLTVKGPSIQLNGKTISVDELKMIPATIMQDIMQSMPATAPATPAAPAQTTVVPVASPSQVVAVPVASPSHVVTAPAPAVIAYRCYWMDSSSGKNVWVLFPSAITKFDCYSLDSCSGGSGNSGGGCYKWATSADANGEAWH